MWQSATRLRIIENGQIFLCFTFSQSRKKNKAASGRPVYPLYIVRHRLIRPIKKCRLSIQFSISILNLPCISLATCNSFNCNFLSTPQSQSFKSLHWHYWDRSGGDRTILATACVIPGLTAMSATPQLQLITN